MDEMGEGLRPAPPPIKAKVVKAGTFSIDVSKGNMIIPDWHNEKDVWPAIHEYVVHEFNHGRICGIPYSFIEQKRLEAAIMGGLECKRGKAGGLLNTIGDIVNDVFVHGKEFHGYTFDMQRAQEIWVKRFPPAGGSSGRHAGKNPSTQASQSSNSSQKPRITSYYILCLLYQSFVGGNILKDDNITSRSEFRQLKSDITTLIEQAATNPEMKDTRAVVDAAKMINALCDDVEEDTCMSSRPATPEELQQIAQFAVEFGLSGTEFSDLVNENNLTPDEARELLYKARRLRSAEMVYKSQVGFREFIGGAGEPIYAPSTRGFRPSDRDVAIESVALYPHDPRRWRTPTKYVLTNIPTKYDKELGFKKVIAILDISGSTGAPYQGRPVITHEWDTLASLVGFVMDNHLKLDCYLYNHLVIPVKGAPMDILTKVQDYHPGGSTDLGSPLTKVRNETDCLIVVITDGEVNNSDVLMVESLTKHNKVIGMIINQDYEGTAVVDTRVKGFTLYTASPGNGQRVIFSELKGMLTK